MSKRLYSSKVDANQAHIVKGLRNVGATVSLLHRVGDGIPDLLVGIDGKTYLMEIKDGAKPPSERKLTPDEQRWHDTWQGERAHIVLDLQQAYDIIGYTGGNENAKLVDL